MSPLIRSSVRHLLRHPWQMGLAVLGITLGVAIAVGMDVAIGSARTAFRISAETVAGRATHQLVGGPHGVASDLYRTLRVELGIRETAPVVEDDVGVIEAPGRVFQLLGIDPLAEQPIRPLFATATEGGAQLLSGPSAWLSAETAAELGRAVGDTIHLSVGGQVAPLRLAGLLEPNDRFSARALAALVVTDIATAQHVLDTDRLSHIDVRLPPGPAGDASAAAIRAALPTDVRMVPAGTRSDALLEMTRAFSTNLTALSLLAVVFGIFFIYNAVAFSVVQRRALFGTMRALGTTRGQVLRVVLGEAALLGAIGGTAGVLLGIALGRGLVGFVTTTINDLYFAVSVRDVSVPALTVAKGAALAVGGSLLGALLPAWEAVAATPRVAMVRSALESTMRRTLPRLAIAGLMLALLGAALLAPRAPLGVGFAGLFAIMIGCALLVPIITTLLMRAVRPLCAALGGPLGRLAAGGVTASLSRTAPALAALMVAVATTVALGVMIGSFRTSVAAWLDTTLQADVYVSAPSGAAGGPPTLDPAIVEAVSGAEGVAAVATFRVVELLGPAGPIQLRALDPADERSREAYRLLSGGADAWPAFRQGDALVAEPLAYHAGLQVGDTITLPTDRGARAVRVAGVFHDYGPGQGAVLVHRATYDALFDDPGISSMAVYMDGDPDALARRVHAIAAATGQRVNVRSSAGLREASLEVFDRTFLITAVLRALAFIVAFVGLLAALAALQLERAREFGVLRASGLTPGQLRAVVTAQTGLMGLAAGIIALPVGALLAALMVHVINRRSFGWSLDMHFPAEVALQAIALAVGAALLAGIVPALRLARTSPAVALREE